MTAASRAHLLQAMAFACLFLIGCDRIWGKEKNPIYCLAYPDEAVCMVPPDANTCSSSAMCSAPASVCDLASMMCVQCTQDEHDACTGTTPACIDHTCQRCSAHAQCESNACLPDGSCADTAQVAYVDPKGTDNLMCSKASPCTKVLKALTTSRPYVKFHDDTDEAVTISGGRVVTFLADPGARLTRSSGNGPIVTVQGDGTALSVYDLSISNAPNSPSGVGCSIPNAGAATLSLTRVKLMNNPGGGISATAGTLFVSQSRLSSNTGGGIVVSGASFVIVNNFFFSNGSGMSMTGGVSILTNQAAANRLEFNSFSMNQAQQKVGAAIQCTAGIFTARNNIMSGNGTLTNLEQVGGPCTHAYSIVRPGTLPVGSGNQAVDPLFKDTTTGDLHLQPGSPAADAADPSSDLTGIAAQDIDGDSRARPADLGADKYHP